DGFYVFKFHWWFPRLRLRRLGKAVLQARSSKERQHAGLGSRRRSSKMPSSNPKETLKSKFANNAHPPSRGFRRRQGYGVTRRRGRRMRNESRNPNDALTSILSLEERRTRSAR